MIELTAFTLRKINDAQLMVYFVLTLTQQERNIQYQWPIKAFHA